MDVRVKKETKSGVFIVTITTENFTASEETLMATWGVPSIEVGGTFNLVVDTNAASYSIDPGTSRINTFTLVKQFPSRDTAGDELPYADEQAADYATQIEARLATAITTLKARVDSFAAPDSVNTY